MGRQQKDFGFGEEEAMVQTNAAKFFADNCPIEKIHSQVAGRGPGELDTKDFWDEKLWEEMVEMGWPAINIPESNGGVGMPLCAAVGLVEEIGRAAAPSPLISTLCASFVLKNCDSPAASDALGEIAKGTSMALAITNKQGSWEPGHTDAIIENGKLYGASYFVQDAKKSKTLIVSARSKSGIGLYAVDVSNSQVEIKTDLIVDLTRDQAHVNFKGAHCTEIATEVEGEAVLARSLPSILTIVSSDMVGAGEWLLQTTVEYAKTRVQFEHPIGFFQAIKHPLVNVMIEVDKAKSLTYNAACSIDHGEDAAEVNARMAKAQASEMAIFSSSRAVQFHGGIGFTWECFIQIYFKRQMHNQALFGDAKYQRQLLSDLCIGKIN